MFRSFVFKFIYLYKFDAEVNDKEGFLWKKGKRLKINRSLTPIQKNLGVNILNVNVDTGECTYV